MITLKVECCTCSKGQPLEINVDTVEELILEAVKTRIEKFGWVVEINGNRIDTYCSTKCAA